jgi:hypothetical protein
VIGHTRLRAVDALLLTGATGLRLGELRNLELDCVHQIDGHGAWLTVPLGKLARHRTLVGGPFRAEDVTSAARIYRNDMTVSFSAAATSRGARSGSAGRP